MRLVIVEQLADLLLQLVPVLLTELLAAQLLPAVELGHGSLHYPHVLHLQHLIIDVGPGNKQSKDWSNVLDNCILTCLLHTDFPCSPDTIPWQKQDSLNY